VQHQSERSCCCSGGPSVDSLGAPSRTQQSLGSAAVSRKRQLNESSGGGSDETLPLHAPEADRGTGVAVTSDDGAVVSGITYADTSFVLRVP
jgi:hypothetical protein